MVNTFVSNSKDARSNRVGRANFILGYRPTAGQRPLNPRIMVRIHVPQQIFFNNET